ncbi:MAG: hypothetical protein SFV54_22560, partial [Bryobacteraceae bacterium]|nr:hypothetical protein [Bryobacteraceae bacterium]
HHYLDTVLRRERRDYFRCLRELERLRKSPLFPPETEALTNSHEANPSTEDPANSAAEPEQLPVPAPLTTFFEANPRASAAPPVPNAPPLPPLPATLMKTR